MKRSTIIIKQNKLKTNIMSLFKNLIATVEQYNTYISQTKKLKQ